MLDYPLNVAPCSYIMRGSLVAIGTVLVLKQSAIEQADGSCHFSFHQLVYMQYLPSRRICHLGCERNKGPLFSRATYRLWVRLNRSTAEFGRFLLTHRAHSSADNTEL